MKNISLVILIVAIAIPFYYGSTNANYRVIRVLHSLISLKHSVISDSTRPSLSANYRAFESLLGFQPLVDADLTADPIATVKQLRSSFAFSTMVPRPWGCQVIKQVYEYEVHTVNAFWINHHYGKEPTNTDQIILYLHGGAYILGNIDDYSGFECHLSRLFNLSVVHLEYRLLPEFSVLDIIDDVVTLYRALLHDGISPSRLIIMGDSAGASLAMIMVQTLLDRRLTIPRGIVAISPFADLTRTQDSFKRNRRTDLIANDNIHEFIIQIICNSHIQFARNDPRVSPLFGSFEGFPPMYVTVGTAELIEDVARQVVDKAQKAGVDVTFEAVQHLQHVYPIFFLYYPEGRNSLDHIHQWIGTSK